jgi:hypothetical protein
MASTHRFENLAGAQYMSLVTTRKNGTPVPTPVWFAQVGDKLYLYTSADSGKVKRIGHTPAVTVAPCTSNGTVTGPAVSGTARVLPESEWKSANDLLNAKYGLFKRLFDLLGRLRRSKPAYIEISPA